jgi:hypothetical protein
MRRGSSSPLKWDSFVATWQGSGYREGTLNPEEQQLEEEEIRSRKLVSQADVVSSLVKVLC